MDPIEFTPSDMDGIDLSDLSPEFVAKIKAISDNHIELSPTTEEIDAWVLELQQVKAEANSKKAILRMGVFVGRIAARFAGIPI